jgi:transposase-like protein
MSTQREKLEARAAFLRGTLHPICPSCGCGDLFTRKVGSKDHQGNTWKRYRCASCNEQFKATVENPS